MISSRRRFRVDLIALFWLKMTVPLFRPMTMKNILMDDKWIARNECVRMVAFA